MWVTSLCIDFLVHHVHAMIHVNLLRQVSICDKAGKQFLHVAHKCLFILSFSLISAQNGWDINGWISNAWNSKVRLDWVFWYFWVYFTFKWSRWSFLSGNIRINISSEFAVDIAGQFLKWANSPDIRDHGSIFLPMIRNIVQFQRLSWNSNIETSKFVFNMSFKLIRVRPIQKFLILRCDL